MTNPLDQLCIDTLRFLSVDAVHQANSGHPGMPMGAAPMAFALWPQVLKFNPRNPDWTDRDRFVLSAGPGSLLLYSMLHLTGYALSLHDIKAFRQWGSNAPVGRVFGKAYAKWCTVRMAREAATYFNPRQCIS